MAQVFASNFGEIAAISEIFASFGALNFPQAYLLPAGNGKSIGPNGNAAANLFSLPSAAAEVYYHVTAQMLGAGSGRLVFNEGGTTHVSLDWSGSVLRVY